jgi:hypothetical protein
MIKLTSSRHNYKIWVDLQRYLSTKTPTFANKKIVTTNSDRPWLVIHARARSLAVGGALLAGADRGISLSLSIPADYKK